MSIEAAEPSKDTTAPRRPGKLYLPALENAHIVQCVTDTQDVRNAF